MLWLTSTLKPLDLPRSRNLLASSSLLCHDAMNLSAPNRTPVYHGTPSPLRAASVQTSLSTPRVHRSVGVEPCRAPNALKSSLELFCQCCASWPGPGSSPPSSLSANNGRFGSRLSPCLAKAPANRSRRCGHEWSRVFPPLKSLGEHQPLRESLVALSGQGPCEQTPALWSLMDIKDLPISPRFTPYDFLSRCKSGTLTTRHPMVEFYLLTFPRFPLRNKEHFPLTWGCSEGLGAF